MHLAERLHQRVDVGNAGAGKPRRRARGDGAGRRGDGRSAAGRSSAPARRRAARRRGARAAPRRRPPPWARRTMSSTWSRSAATRTTPGPPGMATYMSGRPTVRAALGRPCPALPASASRTSGRLAVILDGGSGPAGSRCRRGPCRRDRSRVMRWPFCRGEPAHGRRPTRRGIGRQRLADQPGFAFQRAGDVGFEIAAERALRRPHQHADRRGTARRRWCRPTSRRGESHRARLARSVPRKR